MRTLIVPLFFFFSMSAVAYESYTHFAHGSYPSEIGNDYEASLLQFLVANEQESNPAFSAFGSPENENENENDGNNGDDEEQKCVTVCDKWDRDCVVNPNTGQRKCRRVCRAFGQECF